MDVVEAAVVRPGVVEVEDLEADIWGYPGRGLSDGGAESKIGNLTWNSHIKGCEGERSKPMT